MDNRFNNNNVGITEKYRNVAFELTGGFEHSKAVMNCFLWYHKVVCL